VPALAPDDEMDQVDRCIGYVIDIEARAQRFKQKYPQAQVIEKQLPELNNAEHVQDLFDKLNLKTTDKTWDVVGQVYNNKADDKQSDNSEEFCRDRILQYIQKCEAKGIKLPELPHLDEEFKGQTESIRSGV